MLVDIVHQDRIKLSQHSAYKAKREVEMTHVNVAEHDGADVERPVKEGCGRARRDEGDCGEQDEACHEEVLGKDHWYNPCHLDGSGKVVGLFAVPL